MKKLGIFTKPVHVTKLVNYLNEHCKRVEYVIGTRRDEVNALKFDVGVSYCFPHIVDVGKKDWYNYHPAPLPEYPGLNNYSFAVKRGKKAFGVTLHKMTNIVDQGPIVKKEVFKLASKPTDVNELGTITHYHLFQLFKNTIRLLAEGQDK